MKFTPDASPQPSVQILTEPLSHSSKRSERSFLPGLSVVQLAIWVSCVLLGLDFKGEASGGLYQVSAFITSAILLSAAAYSLFAFHVVYRSRAAVLIGMLLGTYLLASTLTALLQRVPAQNFGVMIAPYILLYLGFVVTSSRNRRFGAEQTSALILPAVKAMTVISIAWTMVYGLSLNEITLATVRHRAVSVLAPIAIAWLASAYLTRRLTIMEKFVLLLLCAALVVGQTRIYALVALICIACTTFAYSRTAVGWLARFVRISCRAAVIVAVAILAWNVFGAYSGLSDSRGLLALWMDRLTAPGNVAGIDITTATRLAEYSDQMVKLTSSPVNFLIGSGLGAPYTYSGHYADIVEATLGADAIPVNYWNGGHSLFVYSVFASGVVFGTLFLGVLLYGASLAIGNLARARHAVHGREEYVAVAAAYLSIIFMGLSAFPLGSRPLSLSLGVLLAMLIAHRQMLRGAKSRGCVEASNALPVFCAGAASPSAVVARKSL